MSDVLIRTEGRAGRITLTREKALNALTYDMCIAIESAIEAWRGDANVDLILLDAAGEKAFCAGGDVAEIYHKGVAGDFNYARRFWRDEYRMNAKLAAYPKPIVSFLNGFTMGGGVGLGGHVSHRIVGESTKISMPEVAIGFVPDVGGSFRLAQAPGRVGDYLGLTVYRMGAADALFAGFADVFVPEAAWDDLKAALCSSGSVERIEEAAKDPGGSPLAALQPEIDRLFDSGTLDGIRAALAASTSDFAAKTLKSMAGNAPLSMALTLEMLSRLRAEKADFTAALAQEYRVSHRILPEGDFLEGVRALIIEKDKSPKWQFADGSAIPEQKITAMLAPLGADELYSSV
jgi:enoyl-CoA hydratase/carnithine racemase